MAVPTASHKYFTTSTVTQDSIGSATLTQNNATYQVTADTTLVPGITIARFPGTGTTPTALGNYSSPSGNSAFLYRSGQIVGDSSSSTVCFWWKHDNSNNYAGTRYSAIYYERSTSWGDEQIYVRAPTSNKSFIDYRTGNNDDFIATSDTDTGWKFCTVTYSSGTCKIYENGVPITSRTTGNRGGSAGFSYFGQTRDMNTCFKGYMYNLRIWTSTVLTDAEVLEAYQEDSSKFISNITYLFPGTSTFNHVNGGSSSLNTTTYLTNGSAVNCIKTSTTTRDFHLEYYLPSSINLVNKKIVWNFYIKDQTTLNKIEVLEFFMFEGTTTNISFAAMYFQKSNLVVGWNTVAFDLSHFGGSITSVNWQRKCDKIRIDFNTNNNSDTFAAGDIIVDSMYYTDNQFILTWNGTIWVDTILQRRDSSSWNTNCVPKKYVGNILPSSGWVQNSLTSFSYTTSGLFAESRCSTALSTGEHLGGLNTYVKQFGSRWIATASTGWNAIRFNKPVFLRRYEWNNVDDVTTRSAKDWTIQCSLDSTNGSDGTWVTLDTQTNKANTTGGVNHHLTHRFLWYRVNITANNGAAGNVSFNTITLYTEYQ